MKKPKFYLVTYYLDNYRNGDHTIHLWPGSSTEDCNEKYQEILQDPKFGRRIYAHDIIKAEAELTIKSNMEDEMVTKKKKQQPPVGDKPENKDLEERYKGKSKTELKKILEDRKVRVFYHDTIDILVQKCIESESK